MKFCIFCGLLYHVFIIADSEYKSRIVGRYELSVQEDLKEAVVTYLSEYSGIFLELLKETTKILIQDIRCQSRDAK